MCTASRQITHPIVPTTSHVCGQGNVPSGRYLIAFGLNVKTLTSRVIRFKTSLALGLCRRVQAIPRRILSKLVRLLCYPIEINWNSDRWSRFCSSVLDDKPDFRLSKFLAAFENTLAISLTLFVTHSPFIMIQSALHSRNTRLEFCSHHTQGLNSNDLRNHRSITGDLML